MIRKHFLYAFAILLGIVITILCYFAYQAIVGKSTTNSELTALGILTSENVKEINSGTLDSRQYDNILVFYQPNTELELSVIDYLLNTPQIKSINTELVESKYQTRIIIDRRISINDLLAEYGQTFVLKRMGNALVSGNFIYLGIDFGNGFIDPEHTADTLTNSLYYQLLFSELNTTSNIAGKYDLSTLNIIQEFIKITQPNGTDPWEAAYPRLISQYQKVTDHCSDIVSPETLLFCELAISQSHKYDLLPPTNKDLLLDYFPVQLNQIKVILGETSIESSPDFLAKFNVSKNNFAYSAWGISRFTTGNYEVISGPNYYTVPNINDLLALEGELVKNNWVLTEKTEPVTDSQFAVSKYRVSYNNDNPLQRNQLSLLVFNTADINADCIIKGIGQTFCDQNSLFKNSGVYFELVVGSHNRYK